jgi:thioredoxin 1
MPGDRRTKNILRSTCMATVTATAQNFEETVTGNDIVLVDFWADWCGPCKMFAPVFEASSDKHDDVVFAKVDTEAEQQLAAEAQIRSIPTLMAFREGILVFNQAGALPSESLEELITAVRDLDMAEVRAKISAAAEQQQG